MSAINNFIEGETIRQIHADGTVAYGIALLRQQAPPTVGFPFATFVLDAIAHPVGRFLNFKLIEGLTSGTKLTFVAFGPGGLLRVHEFHLAVNILEMRAYMLIGVPGTELGEFGCHYDAGLFGGFYDLTGATCFYDGYALGTANLQKSIYNAVKDAKAAGVGFDLYQEHELAPLY